MIWPLLKTRRWLGFTIVVITTILAFGLLSSWQWSRAEQKREQRVELQSAVAAEPVPLSAITLPEGGSISAADQWRTIEARGTYLADSQVLVRKRPLDARNGFWVMTPLQIDRGPTLWVNRGWLATSGDALSTPDTPPAPTTPVEVTGLLRPFEEGTADGNAGLPPGQVAAVAPVLLPAQVDSFPGYLQLTASAPDEPALTILPLPEIDEGRNISYAVQWLIFAAVAMGGWFFFLRREAIEDAAAQSAAVAVTGSDNPTEGTQQWTSD